MDDHTHNPHDYDSLEGITTAVSTLEGLNKLIDARNEAGYGRGERMQEWLVLGQLWFDTCGNIWTADRELPITASVMTMEAFRAEHARLDGRCSFRIGGDIPRPNVYCQHCNQPWTLANYKDCETVTTRSLSFESTDCMPGGTGQIAGHTLQELHTALNSQNDGKTYSKPREVINLAYVDLTPHPTIDDYPTNRNGHKTFEGDYVVQPGDEIFGVCSWSFFHVLCLTAQRRVKELAHFTEIFEAAGYPVGVFTPIKNEYWGEETSPPWFRVKTAIGEFIIGWRKRVISITWPRHLAAPPLFENEDVTQESNLIHAWGRDKCIEYLRAIRDLARG